MTSNASPTKKTAAKRGSLAGAALSAEVLDSSRRVLTRTRGAQGALVGLQQWFTPPEAAELISLVMDSRYPDEIGQASTSTQPVLDPTAGAGNLLAPYNESRRLGVEIDPDHTATANYREITADAQNVVPMLRAVGASFPRIVLNPPFGLSWRDPAHSSKEINSSILAYLWALDLLNHEGLGAIILGTDRLDRSILSMPEGRGVHTVVDVDGPLFDGVSLPTSIAFFAQPANRLDPEMRPKRLTASREHLPRLAASVVKNREASCIRTRFHSLDALDIRNVFSTVRTESNKRRRAANDKKAKTAHDVSLAGGRIRLSLSPFARVALAQERGSRDITLLHNQNVQYLGHNTRDWRAVEELERRKLLTISPELSRKADEVIADAVLKATPLFTVPSQMRLGWLVDLDRIPCKLDDPERSFEAGKSYPLETSTRMVNDEEERVVERKNGEPELRRFITERRLLRVTINDHDFDESPEDVEYVTTHFDLPDPGSVATRFPKELARAQDVIDELATEIHGHHLAYHQNRGLMHEYKPFRVKPFQRDHMSRLLVKRRGMLAHQQGLGKTLMLMILARAQVILGAKSHILFITKQDLIGQWNEEAVKYFGHTLEEIRTPAEARAVKERVKAGEAVSCITYYECLSVVGRKLDLLDHKPLDHKQALNDRLIAYKNRKTQTTTPTPAPADSTKLDDDPYPPDSVEKKKPVDNRPTSRIACPECGEDTSRGWTAVSCENCGYVHRRIYVKPAYSHITRTFNKGVVAVDEISEIRGDESLRSKSVRALGRCRHVFGATGTPMTNFVSDSFNGLGMSLGFGSAAFPYAQDARGTFERDFAVLEYMMGREEDEEAHLRKRRKVLPRVANVSQFWRLTQPGVSRCRKEQTGEKLVPKTYYPIEVPMGVGQARAHHFWLDNFASYFQWRYPDHELQDRQTIERFAAALGQLWRLETAATLPASDAPSHEWSVARNSLGDLSNYTPAILKVLETAMRHAAKGEKVLIGSDLVETGPWIAARLREKGIAAVHITDIKNGRAVTKNPRKRAAAIQRFKTGDAQVLCCGVNAMQLGHNLDMTQVAIMHGLPYSYGVFSQFIERVHRLTSTKPVSIYSILPRRSLAEHKWRQLRDKGDSADLAFDGEMFVQNEKPVDWNKIIRQMKAQGIKPTGDEIPESEVEAAWRKIVPLAILAPTHSIGGFAWPSADDRSSNNSTPTLPLAPKRAIPDPKTFPKVPALVPMFAQPARQPSLF